jgi:co-chaperonin GroES (HSP10)
MSLQKKTERDNILDLENINLYALPEKEFLEIVSHPDFIKAINYNIIVVLPKVEEKTKGGLFLAKESLENAGVGNNIGRIVSMGLTVGEGQGNVYRQSKEAKVGDWINYNPHVGYPSFHFNHKFLTITDQSIMHIVPRPDLQTDGIHRTYKIEGVN